MNFNVFISCKLLCGKKPLEETWLMNAGISPHSMDSDHAENI